MCENLASTELNSVVAFPQDGVHVAVKDSVARAPPKNGDSTKTTESAVPQKKRKTRRGKCKRRNAHPYIKNYRKSNKIIKKPEAPHNSNQFLLEDHGNIRLDELDQKLKSQASRTRDSSFSVDNDSDIEDEFYSSPDDEQEYLIKEFDDQYETEHAERLYSMSKNELIQEYLLLESKVESLTKRLLSKETNGENADVSKSDFDLQSEINRLTVEVDVLRRENNELKSKISVSCTSDSADSETDSSESCSSSSSSAVSGADSPVVDYTLTNGHSPSLPIS